MASHYKLIQKSMLNSVSIVLAAAITIIGQTQSPVSASLTKEVSTSEVASANHYTLKTLAQNQAIYRSKQFGFKFNYSRKDFVVNNGKNFTTSSNPILAIIEIWTQEHARKIEAGAYKGGAEYPANVQVTVYRNPQRLSLQRWIQQGQQFVAPSQLKYTKIAGRNAIQFQSSGLYESKKVALVNPKDANIIVITFSQTGSGNNDAKYQRAYTQVLSSLSFNQ